MANIEVVRALAQLMVKLGLITMEQMQDALADAGAAAEPEEFCLVCERKGLITPYQTSKLLKGDTEGYFLGGYRLLYKIASGSFGRVFRADDPETGRVVAIKVLRRRWSDNDHVIELFEREGKLGQTLQHPNIVEILHVSHDPVTNQFFIVMEFVEGGNLRELQQTRNNKKFDPADALRIMEECAAGLAFAYAKGITHRDIKLTNVLISSSGVAKLVDFGLAGLFASGAFGRLDDSKLDRTVDYAGLELTTGTKRGDTRSDIYFLGCVLYELLTGRPPLDMTKDKNARMQKYRFLQVKPMSRDEVQGPGSLFNLVETMMALDPRQRYQTPSQLHEAIREVRRDVEGSKETSRANAASSARSVFVVEKDERLQDAVRDKLKELGYRVLIAADPARAIDRFRQQPFDALVVDAGTTGEEGLLVFERLMKEAERKQLTCAGILVLSDDQADWAGKIDPHPSAVTMVRPITLKQLHKKLQDLVPPR
jgi:eukaryotic-like serine/threonine-protein kinase